MPLGQHWLSTHESRKELQGAYRSVSAVEKTGGHLMAPAAGPVVEPSEDSSKYTFPTFCRFLPTISRESPPAVPQSGAVEGAKATTLPQEKRPVTSVGSVLSADCRLNTKGGLAWPATVSRICARGRLGAMKETTVSVKEVMRQGEMSGATTVLPLAWYCSRKSCAPPANSHEAVRQAGLPAVAAQAEEVATA